MKKLSVILMSGLLSLPGLISAQEVAESSENAGFNKYSVRPIHESDIMFKKTIIRAVDLREKQNKPMFSKNREITRFLIEAVQRGDIKAYATDSLQEGKTLTIEEFNERMKMPVEGPEYTAEELEIMKANGEDVTAMQAGANDYLPTDLYQMEIKEDLIFDKQRSRMYYDVHAITVYIPADHPANIKGIQLPLASFEYKELCDKLFKDNPKTIWFNPQNDQQHKNLKDAFELRLFSSYIIKVSNPNDAYLVDIYGGDQQKGIMASQWAAFELLEYEHNLWEF
ncbi:MAG: gliding motility protein GldN [Cytophagaceae bacterium]